MSQEWKKSWKNSEKPEKQRKYRRNAPYHHQKKFISVHLAADVRDRVGTRSLPIREGDQAEIMRGDWKGLSGRVEEVNYQDQKVELEDIERERVDTSDARISLEPSNLTITKLNLDDDRRLQKYDVSEEEKDQIRAIDEAEDETDEDDETASDEDTDSQDGDDLADIEDEIEEAFDETDTEDDTKEGDN
jgi:large subunit ribosomal protein L24